MVHARQEFDRQSWTEDLERCTGFTWSEILPAVQHIRRIRSVKSSLVAVEIKYRDAYVSIVGARSARIYIPSLMNSSVDYTAHSIIDFICQ